MAGEMHVKPYRNGWLKLALRGRFWLALRSLLGMPWVIRQRQRVVLDGFGAREDVESGRDDCPTQHR